MEVLLARLDLPGKVRLLTARNAWWTRPEPRIGLRRLVFADGPAGVRGDYWDERDPSLSLPCGTALAATWDPGVAERYGAALGREARRKGVDVLLGPTINLHRSPLGGRSFESFGEDPMLCAAIARAYVTGVQSCGVAATAKHYVANDSETERHTVDVQVDERTLREVYLAPFEAAVGAGVLLVMSAYNGINGAPATENPLLATPLRSEWGFDGVVVSDWGAGRSLASARLPQDLMFPGPESVWGDALVAAVRDGDVAEQAVDAKVRNLLVLADRLGALDGSDASGGSTDHPAALDGSDASGGSTDDPAEPPRRDPVDPAGVALARSVAAEGMVLLRNAGELPWTRPPRSLAVIGESAAHARVQGGGSATVLPAQQIPPLRALRDALPDTEIVHRVGAVVDRAIRPLPAGSFTDPYGAQAGTNRPGSIRTGVDRADADRDHPGPAGIDGSDTDPAAPDGMDVRFRDAAGIEVLVQRRTHTSLVWLDHLPLDRIASLHLRTRYTPPDSGTVTFALRAKGTATLSVGAHTVAAELPPGPAVTWFGGGFGAGGRLEITLQLRRAEPVDIAADIVLPAGTARPGTVIEAELGTLPPADDPDVLIAQAAEAARRSDAAVVVVGTTPGEEAEGFDRSTLALPGRQDDLVAAVAAANPRTVVVVNAGAPVLTPWRDRVAAVLAGWFGGQQFGPALADVLLGRAEPGGRLPMTWPDRDPLPDEAEPLPPVRPVAGVLDYREGLHIGYRAWLRTAERPAFWFGEGMGYTNWRLDDLVMPDTLPAGHDLPVTVTLTNTGDRPGKQVVQVYAARPGSELDRPVRWLAGFTAVRLPAGASRRISVTVPARALAHWDGGWRTEPGTVRLAVGFAAADLPMYGEVTIRDDP
jgi:beta-glucosidase